MLSSRSVRFALFAASSLVLGMAASHPPPQPPAGRPPSLSATRRPPLGRSGAAAIRAMAVRPATYNAYGRDLRTAAGNNDQRMAAIESVDSDKEGNSNLVEITQNAQPGWCVATTPGCDNNSRTPPASMALLDPPAASNQPPVANAGGPYSAAVGAPVTLNGSGSRDPDGSIASYAWTFGNSTSGSGATPSATYATAGTFAVTLTVTDNGGASNQASTTVTVTANTQPPVANAGGPYAGAANVAINFTGAASRDPDGNVVSYLWSFGDGTEASGVTAVHSYVAAGTYTVRLTVTDNDGLTNAASTTAQVTDGTGQQSPVANPAGPYQGTTASPVAFDGSTSTDPDGTIVSYDWTFGDGGTASGAKPTHAYSTRRHVYGGVDGDRRYRPQGIRLDNRVDPGRRYRGELVLSELRGLSWRPMERIGRRFIAARPPARRRCKFLHDLWRDIRHGLVPDRRARHGRLRQQAADLYADCRHLQLPELPHRHRGTTLRRRVLQLSWQRRTRRTRWRQRTWRIRE